MLPNFLCVGAQKSGTTTLYEILRHHPEIFLPRKVKETKFFVYDDKYALGKQWYEQQYFSEYAGQPAVGEVDPAIMFEIPAAQRIYDTLGPATRLIFLLRNPATRAYSHYLMSCRKGYEHLPFDQALHEEAQRLETDRSHRFQYSYLSRGYYSVQIKRFLSLFPRENMLFLIMEQDLIRNRKDTFDRLQDFLGVGRYPLDLSIRSNEASEPRSKWLQGMLRGQHPLRRAVGTVLPPTMRRWLHRTLDRRNRRPALQPQLDSATVHRLLHTYFMHDIEELEQIIRRPLHIWYEPHDGSAVA